MAAAVQLTPGAVAAIAELGDGRNGTLQPVLQVVEMRMVNNTKNLSAERFRMALSDGEYTLQAMLATSENPRARDGSIRMGSILHLREFTCSTIRNRRIIIVLQLDVLQSEHDIIGNSEPFEMKNVRKEEQHSGTITSVSQGMLLAEIPRKTVAEITDAYFLRKEITDVLGYLVKPDELFTVKATLSAINSENLCYVACPLAVNLNGDQCDGAVISNGYGWWHCDGCNMTYAACDYRYRVFVQLVDSTGEIYATSTSQEVGEKMFGQTARELYLMKYEKQDHAQYNKIVMGVRNREYLFEVKLNPAEGLFSYDESPVNIVKVESVDLSDECRRLVNHIDLCGRDN